jgi:hypothetical protein
VILFGSWTERVGRVTKVRPGRSLALQESRNVRDAR